MFNPVQKAKEFVAKKKLEERQAKYIELLKAGGLFIQYVWKDLEDAARHDRPERRRFTKYFEKEGKFNSDMAAYYFKRLEEILVYIDKYKILEKQAKNNVKKQTQQKPIVSPKQNA